MLYTVALALVELFSWSEAQRAGGVRAHMVEGVSIAVSVVVSVPVGALVGAAWQRFKDKRSKKRGVQQYKEVENSKKSALGSLRQNREIRKKTLEGDPMLMDTAFKGGASYDLIAEWSGYPVEDVKQILQKPVPPAVS